MTSDKVLQTGLGNRRLDRSGDNTAHRKPAGENAGEAGNHGVGSFAEGHNAHFRNFREVDRSVREYQALAFQQELAFHGARDIDGGKGLPKNFASNAFSVGHDSTAIAFRCVSEYRD